MTQRIVTGPSLYQVGSTRFDPDGFQAFLEGEGLEEIAGTPGTPLRAIWDRIDDDTDTFSHEETMPEFGGRFCYDSWAKGRPTDEYNENILEMAHGSVLEHTYLNLVITGLSRSLTHELVRHRVGASPSQASQRFINMANSRFVMPPLLLHFLEGDTDCAEAQEWLMENTMAAESYEKWQAYLVLAIESELSKDDTLTDKQRRKAATKLIKRANEAARSQMPNASETKMLWTVNLRTLRHFIEVRGDDAADLEIRRFACMVAAQCKTTAPTIFADIEIVPGSFGVGRVTSKYHKV